MFWVAGGERWLGLGEAQELPYQWFVGAWAR
jgi:hypothetical protein